VGLGALPLKPPWRQVRWWSCGGLQWIAAAPPPQLSHSGGAQRSLEERHQGRRNLHCAVLCSGAALLLPPPSSVPPRRSPAIPPLPTNQYGECLGWAGSNGPKCCLFVLGLRFHFINSMLILSFFFPAGLYPLILRR
jgi:hypothetical protein